MSASNSMPSLLREAFWPLVAVLMVAWFSFTLGASCGARLVHAEAVKRGLGDWVSSPDRGDTHFEWREQK